jgi:hypothetical protein
LQKVIKKNKTCLLSGSLNEVIEDILDIKDQKDEEFKSNFKLIWASISL